MSIYQRTGALEISRTYWLCRAAGSNKPIQTDIAIDTVKKILPRATHKRSWVLWKGSSLAILELDDGSKIRLAISYYGGFFSVIGTSGYFMFENETDRNEFSKIFGGIIQNKFIPERIKRNEKNSS